IGPDCPTWKVVLEDVPFPPDDVDEETTPTQWVLGSLSLPQGVDASQLAGRWISSAHSIASTGNGSFMLLCRNKDDWTKILRQGVTLLGQEIRARRFSQRTRRLQCIRCWEWGHSARSCKSTPVCVRCGGARHDPTEPVCKRTTCCRVCGATHRADA